MKRYLLVLLCCAAMASSAASAAVLNVPVTQDGGLYYGGTWNGSLTYLQMATDGAQAYYYADVVAALNAATPAGYTLTVDSALLKFDKYSEWGSGSQNSFNAYYITQNWDEATGVSGAAPTAGGLIKTQDLEDGGFGYKWVDVADAVRAWKEGIYTNYGVMVNGVTGSYTYSRETPAAAPVFEIYYTLTPTFPSQVINVSVTKDGGTDYGVAWTNYNDIGWGKMLKMSADGCGVYYYADVVNALIDATPAGYTLTVNSALLKFYKYNEWVSGSQNIFNAYYITQNWDEATGVSGAAPTTGDLIKTSDLDDGPGNWGYRWVDVADAVNAWKNGSKTNYGVMVNGATGNYVLTREDQNNEHPVFEIYYTLTPISTPQVMNVAVTKDGGLYYGGTWNGSLTYLQMATDGAQAYYYADVVAALNAATPAGYTLTVDSALLKFYKYGEWANGWYNNFDAYYIEQNWAEATGVSGAAPLAGALIRSEDLTDGSGLWGYKWVDVRDAVRAWQNGSHANYGVMVNGVTGSYTFSREDVSGKAPVFEIHYTVAATPKFMDHFNGSALNPSNWTVASGSPTVSDSLLTFTGSQIVSNQRFTDSVVTFAGVDFNYNTVIGVQQAGGSGISYLIRNDVSGFGYHVIGQTSAGGTVTLFTSNDPCNVICQIDWSNKNNDNYIWFRAKHIGDAAWDVQEHLAMGVSVPMQIVIGNAGGAVTMDGVNVNMTERVNYGAVLEPVSSVIHGAGQIDGTYPTLGFNAINDYGVAMGSPYSGSTQLDRYPVTVQYYCDVSAGGAAESLGILGQKIDQWQSQGQYVIPQIGVGFTSPVSDEAVNATVEGLKSLKRPIFLRIGYEFNGGYWGTDSTAFKSDYIKIVNAVRAAGVEFASVWCPYPGFSGASWTNLQSWYPGDDYVDWFGVDLFRQSDITGSNTASILDAAEAHNKPVMIGEATPKWNPSQANSLGAQGGVASWNGWFDAYFNLINSRAGIKAMTYINWDWSYMGTLLGHSDWTTWGDARLEATTAEYVRNLYISQISNGLYVQAGSDRPAFAEVVDEPVFSDHFKTTAVDSEVWTVTGGPWCGNGGILKLEPGSNNALLSRADNGYAWTSGIVTFEIPLVGNNVYYYLKNSDGDTYQLRNDLDGNLHAEWPEGNTTGEWTTGLYDFNSVNIVAQIEFDNAAGEMTFRLKGSSDSVWKLTKTISYYSEKPFSVGISKWGTPQRSEVDRVTVVRKSVGSLDEGFTSSTLANPIWKIESNSVAKTAIDIASGNLSLRMVGGIPTIVASAADEGYAWTSGTATFTISQWGNNDMVGLAGDYPITSFYFRNDIAGGSTVYACVSQGGGGASFDTGISTSGAFVGQIVWDNLKGIATFHAKLASSPTWTYSRTVGVTANDGKNRLWFDSFGNVATMSIDQVTYNAASSFVDFDMGYLVSFASNWLKQDCGPANGWCSNCDKNIDGTVNFEDFAELATYWVQ